MQLFVVHFALILFALSLPCAHCAALHSEDPEERALLLAIWQDPDEDTARLAYADWLQEHGKDLSAEFIRLQCAQAQEYDAARQERLNGLGQQVMPLDPWLVAQQKKGTLRVTFTRGFPERISIIDESLLTDRAQADEFFKHVPFLRALEVSTTRARDFVDNLVGRSELNRLTALDYGAAEERSSGWIDPTGQLNTEQLRRLLDALPALRELKLDDNDLTQDSIRVLLRSPSARQLRFLHISEAESASFWGALNLLLNSNVFQELQELNLRGGVAYDAVLNQLDAKTFPRLGALHLTGPGLISGDVLERFVRSEAARRLRSLRLGQPEKAEFNGLAPAGLNRERYQDRFRMALTELLQANTALHLLEVTNWLELVPDAVRQQVQANRAKAGCDYAVRALAGDTPNLPRFLGMGRAQ